MSNVDSGVLRRCHGFPCGVPVGGLLALGTEMFMPCLGFLLLDRRRSRSISYWQVVTGQNFVGLNVFLAGSAGQVFWQCRGWGLFIPLNAFQKVADVLLVVGFLRPARLVGFGWPKA